MSILEEEKEKKCDIFNQLTNKILCLEDVVSGIKRIIVDEKGYGSTSEVVERLAKLIGVKIEDVN